MNAYPARPVYVGLGLVCIVLIVFSLMMTYSVYRLETKVTSLSNLLEEHRKEERDRFFLNSQDVKLEGVRTREDLTKAIERERDR